MLITRRFLLKAALIPGLVTGWVSRLTGPGVAQSSANIDANTLAAWLDTLIPADDISPAATDVGVHEKLIGRAMLDPAYSRLLAEGCRWLDRSAKTFDGAKFAYLTEDKRIKIVSIAAGANSRSVPRIFFEVSRRESMFHYYAHPDSWTFIGYHGPPQPNGFMNYTDQPQ